MIWHLLMWYPKRKAYSNNGGITETGTTTAPYQ